MAQAAGITPCYLLDLFFFFKVSSTSEWNGMYWTGGCV